MTLLNDSSQIDEEEAVVETIIEEQKLSEEKQDESNGPTSTLKHEKELRCRSTQVD